jgi:hypothetical protein
MFIARYKQIIPLRRKVRRPFVAITIALSFIATLIPVASASLTKSSAMACCVGKAGHCDSGLAAKKVPAPKSEPMCGLHGAEMESDGITIVAEPSHTESQHSHSHVAETNSSQPSAGSPSLSQPCHMNCASCATVATRQQTRERNTLQPTTYQDASLTTLLFYEDQPLLISSNEDWEHVIPRGPPLSLR